MRSVLQILGAASIALAASCGGSGDGPTNPPPTATNAVTVSDNQFSPGAIGVAPGATVTWTWAQGASQHSVTFQSGGSGNLASGATFSRQFPTAGTFTYQCTLHPGMTGTVTVQ
ncbi:MAG TPA: plastocyanin/azurin family copper-binding protein [Gemmatimonadaceae bacterium]